MSLRDEWLKAVEEIVPPNNPDALTTSELAVIWECATRTARERVAKLVKLGKAQKAIKHLPGQGIATAYVLVKKGK